ncbi:MAG: molybdopterin-guanine dinucleotide biosynthesis protein B [Acidiferrobacterales bacterium]
MLRNAHIPVLGFVALSNTGKTTLLAKVLPLLRERGLRVGVVKHARHGFDIDHPGKDSYILRDAGAAQIMIGSPQRWALMTERPTPSGSRLDELLQHLDQRYLDCILVEGFKHETFPKVEVYRPSLGHPLLCLADESIVAVASDGPLPAGVKLPVLDLNNPHEVGGFVHDILFRDGSEYALTPE